MWAVYENHLEVVQALLAADADPNITNVSAPPAMPRARERARGSGGGPHPVIAPPLLAPLFGPRPLLEWLRFPPELQFHQSKSPHPIASFNPKSYL